MSNPYLIEVENRLSKFPKRTSKQNPEQYIGGGASKLRYLGLRVPHLHQTLDEGFTFSNLDSKQVSQIWNQIWIHSDCFEVMALALAWHYDPSQREELKSSWPLLKKWANRIDNWAHSDTLSGIYARLLEDQPELILPTLKKWNRSKNPWLRRQSIVSLLYYSSQRKKYLPFNTLISLVDEQIESDHYYVQKGVGWTLRELGNIYPQETFRYLKKNILRLHPAAFSASIEKIRGKDREILKSLRKNRKVSNRNKNSI